ENDSEKLSHVVLGRPAHSLRAIDIQVKADGRMTVRVARWISPLQVAARNGGALLDDIERTFRGRNISLHGRKNLQIRRDGAAIILGRSGLARIWTAIHHPEFKLGSRLHDVLHACRIIDSRELNEDLVFARAAMFLDDNFPDAKLVNSVP